MGLGGFLFLIFGLCRPRGRFYQADRQAMGFFTGCGVACVGLVVLSSTVFAGIRRATGLTFKRKFRWPPIDPESGERWLKWYDSRMVQINEKAEQRIASTIKRFAGDIESPAIRELWETRLREDVMEKVGRLKARRECMVEVVRQAREAKENPLLEKHKKHPPMMTIYLYIGEWVFDWLVEWMKRNPHFCYEAGTPGVEFGNMRGGLRHRSGRVDEADMMLDSDLFLHYFPMGGEEEPGLAPRAHSFPALPTAPSTSSNPQRAPTAFIASAALPASSSLYSSMPVPSAPEISEKDLAGVSSSPPVSQPHPAPSAPPAEQMAPSSGSRLPIAGTAIHSRVSVQSRYELNEPPPYTPVADDGPVSRLSAEPQ